MELFKKSNDKPDPKKDLRYSTRYADIEFSEGKTQEEKIDWLSKKLNSEITHVCDNVLKLERLGLIYHSDCEAAQEDGNIACVIAYRAAYKRIDVLVEAIYRKHKPVGKNGKQNG